jgi:hypothetical protein
LTLTFLSPLFLSITSRRKPQVVVSARLGGVRHDWAESNTEVAIAASALQGYTKLYATRK